MALVVLLVLVVLVVLVVLLVLLVRAAPLWASRLLCAGARRQRQKWD